MQLEDINKKCGNIRRKSYLARAADEELTRPLARWRNSEPCLNQTPRRNTTDWICIQKKFKLCQYVINRMRQFTVRD